MAYRRRNKMYRKALYNPFGRKPNSTKNATAIRKIQKTLKQVELLFTDTAFDTATIPSTGTVGIQLFTIPEGDGQSDRHGRRIQLKSVHWRGTVNLPSSTVIAEGSDVARLMLIKDTSADGALPGVTDILSSAVYESFTNLENRSRFRILADKFISINCQGVGSNGTALITAPSERHFSIYKKLDLTIEYNDTATTGAIGTITKNNIVLLLISRLGNSAIESCFRFRYTDM